MRVGIVYWSGTGNTEIIAEKARDTLLQKGVDVVFSTIDDIDKKDFFACDAFAFGGPAQGAEEIQEDMLNLSESIEDEIKGKKVVLFGSFGWGDGEYMETWKSILEDKGGIIDTEPVVCLETPDDDCLTNIENAIEKLA